jgi:hypothetical protein
MKQIKFMLIEIVLINSIIKSHQDEQQTLSIPESRRDRLIKSFDIKFANIKVVRKSHTTCKQ